MQISDCEKLPATEKLFPAELSAFPETRDFVEEELERAECPMKTGARILIALEEMFVNVASYAYGEERGSVLVRLALFPGGVLITLRDSGMPFNPLEIEDPDTSLSAGERQVGGLGVFMTKKLMDEVSYAREENENVFSMLKHF